VSAEEVQRFLALIAAAPKSRRSWRVLQCHCRSCGALAVEVFRTPVETAPLVAVHEGLKAVAEPGGSYQLGIDHKGIRAGGPTVQVLFTRNQDGLQVACKCGKHVVPAATLLDAVRDGQTQIVLDTQG
jgi:hypothetical protein